MGCETQLCASFRGRTAAPTYHTSKLVSFLNRALLNNTIEVTEGRGLGSHYLARSERARARGVDLRCAPLSSGPAGVGHALF